MAFSTGNKSLCLQDILNKTSEANILSHYLGITTIPCVINSPLRQDNHPSLGLYTRNGSNIYYTDFATNEHGNTFDLLCKFFGLDYYNTILKIYRDLCTDKVNDKIIVNKSTIKCTVSNNSNTKLLCKVREWKDYDIEYWNSYGITLKWLKYANVYPISHKIIVKNNNKYIFKADKYAYAYVEFKEGNTTIKVYQPYNKKGFKWSNKHDHSVISLWTKVPKHGNRICICSSLKDALCLWINTKIPAIAIQGEGYTISTTACNELRKRYKLVFILLDNDKAGKEDAIKLAKQTGFINLELPPFYGGKDVSDYYKLINNKETFKQIILNLFNYEEKRNLCLD